MREVQRQGVKEVLAVCSLGHWDLIRFGYQYYCYCGRPLNPKLDLSERHIAVFRLGGSEALQAMVWEEWY